MLRCRLFLFFCSNSLEKNGSGRWELGWSRWAKRGTEEKTETTTRCWGHPTRPHGGQSTLPELFPPVPGAEPKLCTCPYSSAPKHQHSTEAEHCPKLPPGKDNPQQPNWVRKETQQAFGQCSRVMRMPAWFRLTASRYPASTQDSAPKHNLEEAPRLHFFKKKK